MHGDSYIKVLARVSIFFVSLLLIYNLYHFIFVHTGQTEGDSLDYHIPIAERLTTLNFIYTDAPLVQQYYPASNEIILALFQTLNLPLNTYNILAWLLLGISCFFLARNYKLDNYYALLFAATILTLNNVVRWLGAQTIDIWLAFFFITSLVLLKSNSKTLLTTLMLGITLGMLFGSKYTAIPFTLILVVFFAKEFFSRIKNFKHLAVFLIPFLIFGVSWYIRNFFLFDNPFYPLNFLIFQGTNLFSDNVASVTLSHPIQMLDAFVAELRIWALAGGAVIFILYKSWNAKDSALSDIKKIILLALALFAIYPLFPTSEQPWIMVSSLRYSYPFIILFVLSIFMYAKVINRQNLLALITVANMVLLHPLNYYPKLVFLYIPLGFLAVYFLDKKFAKKN